MEALSQPVTTPTPSSVVRSLAERPWVPYLFGLGFFTLLTLLGAVQDHFATVQMEKEVSWWEVLTRSAMEWYTFGLISILIVYLAGRFPLERGHLALRISLHLGASVAVSAVYLACLAVMLHGQRSLMDGSVLEFGKVFRRFLSGYLMLDMLLYWAVVAAHHGWHYNRRARARELQAGELRVQLVQARLMALRMQLNPHFLFNTLNTISALIHERPDDADRMVVRLSELLRLTVEGGCPQEVPLSRELAFLQRYLAVEQVRFEDRMEVVYEIEPGASQVLVPCLILQPIVENAVRHGIEARESAGQIRVVARRQGDRLHLEVADNGPGLPAGQPLREGIGLSNTRARLLHLHGAEQRLGLLPAEGGGLRVVLEMPWREAGAPTAAAEPGLAAPAPAAVGP
jgi:hypothetical protein